MTPFPPPQPHEQQPEPTLDPPTGRSRRGRTLTIAAVAALGVSGVVAGSQLVSAASDDDPADDQAPTFDEDAPIDPREDSEPRNEAPDTQPDNEDAEPDTQPDNEDTEPGDHTDAEGPTHGDFDFDLGDFGINLDDFGIDLGSLDEAFADYDACLADRLPDFDETFEGVDDVFGDVFNDEAGGEWAIDLDAVLGDAVTVLDTDSEELLTLFDFGEGDGEITITRTDGEIDVQTSGDVEQVEVPDAEGIDPDLGDLGQAFEDCAEFLPAGGVFDIVGEIFGD
jgi:hypothetical protein